MGCFGLKLLRSVWCDFNQISYKTNFDSKAVYVSIQHGFVKFLCRNLFTITLHCSSHSGSGQKVCKCTFQMLASECSVVCLLAVSSPKSNHEASSLPPPIHLSPNPPTHSERKLLFCSKIGKPREEPNNKEGGRNMGEVCQLQPKMQ